MIQLVESVQSELPAPGTTTATSTQNPVMIHAYIPYDTNKEKKP